MRKTKLCLRCDKEYQPTGNGQKYCMECTAVVHHEQDAKWKSSHLAWISAENKRWRLEHPQYERTWRLAHPEQRRVTNRRWAIDHIELKRAKDRKWMSRHPGKTKNWRLANPERTRVLNGKQQAKRRVLGFVPLNEAFIGCEGHHIDNDQVIYVPKELHRSVSHNIWTGRNMERINGLVKNWLVEDWT